MPCVKRICHLSCSLGQSSLMQRGFLSLLPYYGCNPLDFSLFIARGSRASHVSRLPVNTGSLSQGIKGIIGEGWDDVPLSSPYFGTSCMVTTIGSPSRPSAQGKKIHLLFPHQFLSNWSDRNFSLPLFLFLHAVFVIWYLLFLERTAILLPGFSTCQVLAHLCLVFLSSSVLRNGSLLDFISELWEHVHHVLGR